MRTHNLLFIYVALVSLAAWLVLLLLRDLQAALGTISPGLSILTSKFLFLQLAIWGFAGFMIFGMGYVLIPSFIGRAQPSSVLPVAHLVTSTASLPILAASVVLWSTLLWRAAAGLWALGTVLFLSHLVVSRRTKPRPTVGNAKPSSVVDRLGLLLVGLAQAYLILSSAAFLQFNLERGLGDLWASGFWANLHLYLIGFVVTMIFGVGYNLFPRFLGSRPSTALTALNVVAIAPAPLLFHLHIRSGGPWFALAATVFTIAFACFLANMIVMYMRRSREIQPTFRFLLLAPAFLAGGIAMGLLFAVRPEYRFLSEVHAELNLLGFVAMTIFGVSYYVFPYFPKGSHVPSYRRPMAHLVLSTVGLITAALSKLQLILHGAGPVWGPVVGDSLMLMGSLVYFTCMHRMLQAVWRVVIPSRTAAGA